MTLNILKFFFDIKMNDIEYTVENVSEDVLGLILKKLDIKSATNLLSTSKYQSEKIVKYIYPRLWFNLDDIKKGKYKKKTTNIYIK